MNSWTDDCFPVPETISHHTVHLIWNPRWPTCKLYRITVNCNHHHHHHCPKDIASCIVTRSPSVDLKQSVSQSRWLSLSFFRLPIWSKSINNHVDFSSVLNKNYVRDNICHMLAVDKRQLGPGQLGPGQLGRVGSQNFFRNRQISSETPETSSSCFWDPKAQLGPKSPKSPPQAPPQKWFAFRKCDERGWTSTLSTFSLIEIP